MIRPGTIGSVQLLRSWCGLRLLFNLPRRNAGYSHLVLRGSGTKFLIATVTISRARSSSKVKRDGVSKRSWATVLLLLSAVANLSSGLPLLAASLSQASWLLMTLAMSHGFTCGFFRHWCIFVVRVWMVSVGKQHRPWGRVQVAAANSARRYLAIFPNQWRSVHKRWSVWWQRGTLTSSYQASPTTSTRPIIYIRIYPEGASLSCRYGYLRF